MASEAISGVAVSTFLELFGLLLIVMAFLTIRYDRVKRCRVVAVGVILTAPAFIGAAIRAGNLELTVFGIILTIAVVIILIVAPKLRR